MSLADFEARGGVCAVTEVPAAEARERAREWEEFVDEHRVGD